MHNRAFDTVNPTKHKPAPQQELHPHPAVGAQQQDRAQQVSQPFQAGKQGRPSLRVLLDLKGASELAHGGGALGMDHPGNAD